MQRSINMHPILFLLRLWIQSVHQRAVNTEKRDISISIKRITQRESKCTIGCDGNFFANFSLRFHMHGATCVRTVLQFSRRSRGPLKGENFQQQETKRRKTRVERPALSLPLGADLMADRSAIPLFTIRIVTASRDR